MTSAVELKSPRVGTSLGALAWETLAGLGMMRWVVT